MRKKLRYILTLTLMAGTTATLLAEDKREDIFVEVSTTDITSVGEGVKPDVWNYSDCLAWAVANNPDIRSALLSVLQAEQDILSAEDAWLPSVDFSTTQGYVNYPVSVEGRHSNAYNSSYGVNAAWTVWEGNARKYRRESAKLYKQQQQLSGEDLIKELQVGILQAYLNILYAQETIGIAEQT